MTSTPENTKSGKHRAIPINDQAAQALNNRLEFRNQHCPLSPWVFAHPNGIRLQSIRMAFTHACQRVGLQDFHIHDLRHTCAAWLVSIGIPLAEVRDLLGHSTVRRAVERLDGWSRFVHGVEENKKTVSI
ncbi:MAG: site-specific integrase [Magnetococcales bacterium]|nr:site-specific integrase [Magnetococcales bacterium]